MALWSAGCVLASPAIWVLAVNAMKTNCCIPPPAILLQNRALAAGEATAIVDSVFVTCQPMEIFMVHIVNVTISLV